MPDQDKKKDDTEQRPDEPADLDAASSDTGAEVGSDVPSLETDAAADTDTEGSPTEEPSEESVEDTEETGEAKGETLDDISAADERATHSDDEATPFDDDTTGKAIDEIVAKEGDDLLAAQDAVAFGVAVPTPKKKGFFKRKWVRTSIMLLVLGGITAVAVVPKTRYLALNTAGVRSTSSLTVIDSTTEMPLKGVSVSLAGRTVKTDTDGKVKFSDLKLGPTQLAIKQAGFEEIKRTIIVGWGSNPLGNYSLKATGVQYVIEVRDYLSEQPLEGVEATDGETSAVSDKNGKITLTLGSPVVVKDGVSLSKAGYRSDKLTLPEDSEKPTKTTMVLARKAVYVSKQGGKYDVYKGDLDGQNRELLLAGTGFENSNISLVVSPDGNRAALVSTRDNKRDSSGFLLSSIMLINTENGQTTTIAEGSQVQLIDWVGTRLVYQIVSSSAPATSRYTVTSYNYPDNTRLQLAAASSLTAVASAQGNIYYAVPTDSATQTVQAGLYKIKPDGSGKQRVFEGGLDTVLRSTYGTFSLQSDDGTWYTHDIAAASKTQISSPTSLANRLYADNADRTRSLWVSQGSLMGYEIATNKDTNVKTQGGLAYPIQWLSTTAVLYRVSSGGETADYALSLLGGTAHKVADVTASYGFAQSQ